ncbi:PREDICTED: retinal-specific ATP-binding cassette transporter-like [Branchiostoma belcheri]|uniref:Retinal-specific ATP-binding cassette transporter-like n=1 Tax=Branchiostoma belcheri TaxID=7741 RepID=A0A6P4Y1E9_BRABE|nr:PREDICTED: retinal-specific ATP-binding cassette transporter-like [Branchiostoma belcheri]
MLDKFQQINFVQLKVRLLIEIIWPLILFMILVWIRSSRPPYSQHECHYPSKALPSAGLIPFMQTLICNFDNKCYNQPLAGEAPGRVFEFKDSPLSQLYFDIDELLSNDTELLGLENLVEDYQALQELVEFFNNRTAVVHRKGHFGTVSPYLYSHTWNCITFFAGYNMSHTFLGGL